MVNHKDNNSSIVQPSIQTNHQISWPSSSNITNDPMTIDHHNPHCDDDSDDEDENNNIINTIENNCSRLSLKSSQSNSDIVQSSKFLVFLFLLHGIGALLPWNMLIDAVDFFEFKINQSESIRYQESLLPKYGNSNANISNIKENMFSYISIASKAPNILLQLLNIWFSVISVSKTKRHHLNQSYSSMDNERNHFFKKISSLRIVSCSLTTRIQLSLIIQITIFITLIVFAHCDCSHWSPNLVFIFVIFSTIGLNMANGIYQSCIYGVAARIPQMKFTNAITIGMSLSGTITSLLDIGSIALTPSPQTETIVFFALAAIILFVCLLAEFYYVNYFGVTQRKNLHCTTVIDDDSDDDNENSNELLINLNGTQDRTGPTMDQHRRSHHPTKWQLYLYTIRDIWPQLLNIFFVYFITFSLFPAVVANIHQSGSDYLFNIPQKYFTPVFCFFALNFFTSIGNLLAEYCPLGNYPKRLALLSLTRFVMVPFFLYCNYLPPTAHRIHLQVLINKDWLFLFGIIFLALSAGYLSSLSIMYVPKSVRRLNEGNHDRQTIIITSDREEQLRVEAAGMISVLTVIIGILCGVNSSLIYPQLI